MGELAAGQRVTMRRCGLDIVWLMHSDWQPLWRLQWLAPPSATRGWSEGTAAQIFIISVQFSQKCPPDVSAPQSQGTGAHGPQIIITDLNSARTRSI